MTPAELVEILLDCDHPTLAVVAGDRLATSRLNGEHPISALARAPEDVRQLTTMVGVVCHGAAINLETNEPIGRITTAYALSADDSAAVTIRPDGVTTTAPTEGKIVDAMRDFLGAQP